MHLVITAYLLTGEFGMVYKAHLTVTGIQPELKTVAVKTLKGCESLCTYAPILGVVTYIYIYMHATNLCSA